MWDPSIKSYSMAIDLGIYDVMAAENNEIHRDTAAVNNEIYHF